MTLIGHSPFKDTKTLKIFKCCAKVKHFGCAVSLRELKIEQMFFLKLIDYQKHNNDQIRQM